MNQAPTHRTPSRFGVDIGGTFTDFVYFDGKTGRTRVAKIPTTADAPDRASLEAVKLALAPEEIGSAEHFVHGTTVGLNALLERRGAKVGLLTTQGFRDVLEIARANRLNGFSLRAERARPLVPRSLSLTVRERLNYRGEVLTPIEQDDVREALKTFLAAGVTSIAISFIHAYANPAHELLALQTLRDAGFGGPVTLSHQVSGEYREYERTSTAVIDAFVRDVMHDYLQRLDRNLREVGFKGTSLVIRSGGGAMTFQEASTRSFETIMSGPVGGAQGAVEVARALGLRSVLTADVGGTSFDTCLISDGRPAMLYEGDVAGLPVQAPWVDIRSIGAGGGSIARVDAGGLMRVGPQSAGAKPGPACYDRGGVQPTLTDAECALGMFGKGALASGLVLRRDLAQQAVSTVSRALGQTIEEAAQGIVLLAVASMANAIREITIGKGEDPRGATILAFGGAGPIIADMLARELQISTVVVPPHAGNFSAWGMLGADVVRSASRTRVIGLEGPAIDRLNETLGQLFDELEQRGESGDWEREVCLDMRYVGQDHTTQVTFKLDGALMDRSVDELKAAFRNEFARTFKSSWDGDVEVVSTRALVRQALPPRHEELDTPGDASQGRGVRSQAFSFSRNEMLDFMLLDRSDLQVGRRLQGPAIISEPTTTTYVDAGTSVELHASGSLFLTIGGEK